MAARPFVVSLLLAALTAAGVRWAFTTFHAGNWHPLTWLSHMLDVQLFGLRPRPHHAVSLFIHTANALQLFFLLRALTGALWKSALVAALFAVHPLHVEPVAWAAERKDLLSTFLMLCASGPGIRSPTKTSGGCCSSSAAPKKRSGFCAPRWL